LNILGHARKMLQGLGPAEPPRPQYYDVACIAGHHLQGQRTEGYQALRCPTCGEGIFVLPRSPLPDPPAPKEKKAKGEPLGASMMDDGPISLNDPPPPDPVADEAEVEWLEPGSEDDAAAVAPAAVVDDGFEAIIPKPGEADDRPARPATASPARSKTRPAAPTSGSAPQSAPRHATKPKPRAAVEVAIRPSLGQRLSRQRPVLIIVAILVIVTGTVAFRSYRRRLENLPQLAEQSLAEGRAAKERGDVINARLKLNTAADALEKLGADTAASVRQEANEAAILADMDYLLEEIIADAARSKTAEAWEDRFKSRYKGRAILIDSEITVPKDAPKGTYEIPYRVFEGPSGKPYQGKIDLKGFQLLESKTFKPGDPPITFGARLAGVSLGADGVWKITLEADSGVFMNDRKGLAAAIPHSPEDNWPASENAVTEEPAP
jgi:DNA-directed RNA polymerase subunit RPC12/RpoP